MGLMDVLNGMQNGPRGPSEPGTGGMSPITMALLGLLAYKAVKKFGSDQTGSAPPTQTAGANMAPTSGASGGLGGLLSGGLGGLGGLLTGGAAGGMLSGGLSDLMHSFQNAGQGEVANSWVGNGPNRPIEQKSLEHAIGDEKIDALSRQTGLSRDDLLAALRQHLPELVNHLTPNGRLPTEQEMAQHI